MAKLYTRKSDGTYIPYNSQSVTNIDVIQTTGTSVTAAMSQDAVTKELAAKQDTLTPGNGISIEGNVISASVAEVVDKIVNAGYVFAGVATPITDPGTPNAKVFYIANGKGTYTKFGGLEVTEEDVVVLYYDTAWHKVATGIASNEKLTELVKNDAAQERIINGLKDQVNNYKPIEINGNVTNAADEEDITSENGLLKIKNRSSLNGLGYVILRKNKTFAEQVTQANTIYEIRYDFDLQGRTISIPSGCVLSFVGGVILNGIISGNNTTIDGAEYGAFDGVRLSGSFTNIESNLSWWGCVPFDANNQYDNSSKINDAFRSSISRVGVSKRYGISKPIDISSYVVGICEVPGYKFCGFCANSDFSPITITLPRDNKSYEVNGLFYHYYDEHPSIENLTIDLRYCAKYAIEHIAGYSNIEISNVSIYNALVAGILQYGCEKMTWNTLFTSGCRCGAIISNEKINENDPFSFTTKMGQCNMVTLEHCRFAGGNYGLICHGGTNYKLDSCETAYNSLFGLILSNSSYLLLNYYSEGDCLSNFWIDNNGLISYPNSDGGTTEVVGEWDKGKVHPYLVENNIDGILCKDGKLLESEPYVRAVIYVSRSSITADSPFLSIKPRSYNTTDIKIAERELPTERNASGVDALIISERGNSIILRNIRTYSFSNDIGTMAFTDIVMKATNSGGTFYANNDAVSCEGSYQVRLWYDWFVNKFASFNECKLSPLINSTKKTNKTLIDIKPSNMAYEDLNADQDLWQYGTTIKIPYKRNSLKGYVKNVPVYKRDTSIHNYNGLYFTKEQMMSKFGDRMQVKCKFAAYIPQDITSRIYLEVIFLDSKYQKLSSAATDASGNTLIKAGYYELTAILPVRIAESKSSSWARTAFHININNESEIDVYVSDIYFFDIGDGSELYNNSNPVLVSGETNLRPYLPFVGQSYFDTTLGKSIIWTGAKWVDATGADV